MRCVLVGHSLKIKGRTIIAGKTDKYIITYLNGNKCIFKIEQLMKKVHDIS